VVVQRLSLTRQRRPVVVQRLSLARQRRPVVVQPSNDEHHSYRRLQHTSYHYYQSSDLPVGMTPRNKEERALFYIFFQKAPHNQTFLLFIKIFYGGDKNLQCRFKIGSLIPWNISKLVIFPFI
jgi:hypothetical protein